VTGYPRLEPHVGEEQFVDVRRDARAVDGLPEDVEYLHRS
jgi:hypothetical protein